MIQYAKLATLAFRVISVILLFYALTSLIFTVSGLIFLGQSFEQVPHSGMRWGVLLPVLWGFIVAGVLYVAAPFLGRFAASGLDPSDSIA